MTRSGRAAVRRRRGATIVESALVIGILFLVMFGVYEYGRLLMVENLVEHAAREGAREAVVQFTANQSQAELDAATARVKAAVTRAMAGQESQIAGFQIDVVRADPVTGADAGPWYTAKNGEPIAVRVTGTYSPALRFFMPASVPVRVQSTMTSEAN